jgi:hypothetical protein
MVVLSLIEEDISCLVKNDGAILDYYYLDSLLGPMTAKVFRGSMSIEENFTFEKTSFILMK